MLLSFGIRAATWSDVDANKGIHMVTPEQQAQRDRLAALLKLLVRK